MTGNSEFEKYLCSFEWCFFIQILTQTGFTLLFTGLLVILSFYRQFVS